MQFNIDTTNSPSLFPTTVIGSYPKPECVTTPTWFDESLREDNKQGQSEYVPHLFTKWRET